MKELVPASIFDQAIDELAGAVLVAMASIPARSFPYASNPAERRRCEADHPPGALGIGQQGVAPCWCPA
jgi:hypothetical protein